jgi:Leucine-rich repeat (LRR) protein
VSDIRPLQNLSRLKCLLLADTLVSDLLPLGGLAGLEELWLDNTPVDDLQPLIRITTLRELSIRGVELRNSSVVDSLREQRVTLLP